MNNKKVLALLAVLAAIGLAIYFGARHNDGGGDDNTPKVGVVTEVNLDNWKTEVEDQEANTPVLVFFTNSTVDAQQLDVVKQFAGKNSDVKVVLLNCDDKNVQVLASKYDVSGYPAFRVLHKGAAHKLDDADGKSADGAALQQLLDKSR